MLIDLIWRSDYLTKFFFFIFHCINLEEALVPMLLKKTHQITIKKNPIEPNIIEAQIYPNGPQSLVCHYLYQTLRVTRVR